MLGLLSTSPLLISLSLTLLHFLWQGLLVAVVLKAALLIFNNNKPQLRYALSALAMSANFVLPIITFIVIYKTESVAENTLANSLALNDFIQVLKQPNAFVSYSDFTELLPSFLPYIAIFWLATIFIMAGKLLLEMYHVNNLPRQNTVAPSEELQARFNKLIDQIQLTVRPQLLISLKIDVPMAIGWLKPVVLLPASMISGLSTPQLEMLLLHELAHIRRHDYLVNFFQTIVEILLFFHPAVHWVSNQMRNEREYCSDDVAVQHCGDALAYAHTLADTASLCTKAHHHHTIPSMAMAASGGDLKQRVIRLVDHHCAPKNNISKWFASLTIIFSILILSSKQILTMPLLDIWYDEKPRQSSSQTPFASQKTITHTPENTHQTSITPVKDNPVTLSFLLQTSNNMELTTIIPERLPLIERENNQVNSIQITADTLGSSQFLEDIGSNQKSSLLSTPFQQRVETLAISPALKTAKNRRDNTKNSSTLNPVLSAESPYKNINIASTENKQNRSTVFIDHISRQKEEWVQPIVIDNKTIIPTTPVWQSAEQVKKVVPIYPSVAKRKGIEIDIKVNFTIDVDGQIKDIKFAQHKKINYFKKSIRKAIEEWRYLPAKVNEKPVESQMAKVFSFSLQS